VIAFPRRQVDDDFVIRDDSLAVSEAVEKDAQRRDIEAALVDCVELSAHGLLGLDRKGAVEGAARGQAAPKQSPIEIVVADAPDIHRSAPEPRAIAVIKFLYFPTLLKNEVTELACSKSRANRDCLFTASA
jgi:hypothetical protein